MPKIKVSKSHGNGSVLIKLNKGENLSKPDISKAQKLEGFLQGQLKDEASVIYPKGNLMSLDKFFKINISEYNFYYISAQILKTYRQIACFQMAIERVDFDMEHIFIDLQTGTLHFLYVPVFGFVSNYNICKILDDVLNLIKKNNRYDFIDRFVLYMNSMQYVSLEAIEVYLSGQDQNIGSFIQNYLSFYGFLKAPSNEPSKKVQEAKKPVEIAPDEFTPTGLLGLEGTDLLEEEDPFGTTLLMEEQIVVKTEFAILKRLKTNEEIIIKKKLFKIGRIGSDIDYIPENNTSISRNHASIIIRNDRAYICDNKSKNFTYKNGIKLNPDEEVEIESGDIIRLANEEFAVTIL